MVSQLLKSISGLFSNDEAKNSAELEDKLHHANETYQEMKEKMSETLTALDKKNNLEEASSISKDYENHIESVFQDHEQSSEIFANSVAKNTASHDLRIMNKPSSHSKLSSRPATRRNTRIHGLSDAPPIPGRNISITENYKRVLCQISSIGNVPTMGNNIDIGSHEDFSVSTSLSSGRVATPAERLIYGMSEMQEFVPRPATTPKNVNLPTRAPTLLNLNPRTQNVNGTRNSQSSSKSALLLKPDRQGRSSTAPKFNSSEPPVPLSQRSASASSKHSSRLHGHLAVQRSSSSSREIVQKSDSTINSSMERNDKTSQPVSQKSSSSIIQHLNDSINKIILEEDTEFRDKYSQWIGQIFHTQLSKMKSKLTNQFHQRLEELHEEKDGEIGMLHHRYQEKLGHFEEASEKFQKQVDNLEEENRRVIQNKDSIIEEIQMQLEESQQNFELQLEKQQSYLKSEAEHEKMELVIRHEDSLRKLIESKGRLDPLARSQMESLHRLVSSLKSENSGLKRNLNEISAKRHSKLLSSLGFDESDIQSEALSKSKTVDELRKRLREAEQEKTAISELHSDEIGILKKLNEQANIETSKQLQQAQDTIQFLKKKHDRDIKDLKMTMLNQETRYNKTFVELKRKYGQKIETLTKMIDRIQSDLD